MTDTAQEVQSKLDSFVSQVKNETGKTRHAEKQLAGQLSGEHFPALYVFDETGYGKMCNYSFMRPCDISPRDAKGNQSIVFHCDGSQVEIVGSHMHELMQLLTLNAVAKLSVGDGIPFMDRMIVVEAVNITHLGEASEDD